MRATDRSGIAVMVSVVLATLTVLPLTADRGFLALSWVLIGAIGVSGIVLRRLRLGGATVLGVQTMILVLFSVGLSTLLGAGLTAESWFERYPELWAVGVDHMRTQASPMDLNPGVTLIFVTTIGLIMIMTDLLVLGVGRPAWAIAPPATLFLVPALGLGADTGVFSFLLIAVGYLLILTAEGLNTTARWTRGLSRDSADGFAAATPVVWRAAGLLTAPAIILTVVLGIALPTLALPGLGIGNGPGNGPLQLTDPALDLRRNLNQPDDRTVIEYTSEEPGGVYLRMASLPMFSAAGWGNVEINLLDGEQLGPVPGLLTEPSKQRKTTIRVLDFGSQYLPMPYAPRSFDAAGDWHYEPKSLVVINNTSSQELRNLTYTVNSVDIVPDGPALAQARAGIPSDSDVTSAVPRDLPQELIDLSKQVTKGADTPAAKAAAIQAYLRSDRFTYKITPLPGSGYQALTNFLTRDRTGYCEQFASAMAMMARVNDIPSRVSVGFLPGVRDGDNWKVSVRDMHAWPELYFADFGWVRFEPTPASVTGSAPPWTVGGEQQPGSEPSASPSSSESAATSQPRADPSSAPTDNATPTDTQTSAPLGRTLLTAGIGLAVLLVLAAPATIRVRRRSSRLTTEGLADEQVEAAWAEIRDSVLDYGGSWPSGSPRTIGREVGERLDTPESASMTRVATMVEQSRYARSVGAGSTPDDLPQLAQDVRRGLAAPQSWPRRVLAVLVPRSLFRRGRRE